MSAQELSNSIFSTTDIFNNNDKYLSFLTINIFHLFNNLLRTYAFCKHHYRLYNLINVKKKK